ncbi:hypothetical protein PF007_g1807 [Phytophthora fragariae]|uniref:Uncharacterized protein n=1 Tax=Phytophthora fragariae TaxID=53985 RepID=A0A6A3TIM8_9STRA|nr:hypothetical protein PF009_g2199 [Phytophthora fragariae]KAE9137394.1 hypothetical protein PF007_g1807 [Phytophthora fragariae]KAE9288689.1 hypothetical protein PF001_g20395 [Phytophthora fragariae]
MFGADCADAVAAVKVNDENVDDVRRRRAASTLTVGCTYGGAPRASTAAAAEANDNDDDDQQSLCRCRTAPPHAASGRDTQLTSTPIRARQGIPKY